MPWYGYGPLQARAGGLGSHPTANANRKSAMHHANGSGTETTAVGMVSQKQAPSARDMHAADVWAEEAGSGSAEEVKVVSQPLVVEGSDAAPTNEG